MFHDTSDKLVVPCNQVSLPNGRNVLATYLVLLEVVLRFADQFVELRPFEAMIVCLRFPGFHDVNERITTHRHSQFHLEDALFEICIVGEKGLRQAFKSMSYLLIELCLLLRLPL